MATDLALAPAGELIRLYRAGEASPVEAVRAALARIETHNGDINAFCLVDGEGALAAAAASEARWRQGAPLGLVDGVPATVKDLVLARGWPTRRGSAMMADAQPGQDDAPSVARLREHGAVLLGKTATPEFGWKGVTDSPLTGVTRNPWNPERTPGGSSGGAAAAAILGMGALHIGTDGGGSIRIPSSFSGTFGLKPSFGRVPHWPYGPFGTLAHVGPITRSVADAALMLTVLAGPDIRDSYAVPADGRDYRDGLEDGVAGLRLAFSADLGGHHVDPDVAALVEAAAWEFEALGARVEPAEPDAGDAHDTFMTLWFAGACRMLEPFDAATRALADPGLVSLAEAGEAISLAKYMAAVDARRALAVRLNLFFEDFDLLLLPTMPLAAFATGRDVPGGPDGGEWLDWSPFTYPFNLTGLPAASAPCGLTGDGLPVGLQIVGPRYQDARVLRAARAFERLHPILFPQSVRD